MWKDVLETVKTMLKEIYRMVADEGYYIIISNSDERTRKDLFDLNLWEYKFMEIGKPTKFIVIDEKDKDEKNFHYIYVLKKKAREKPKEVIPVVEEKKEEKKEKKHRKKKK